MSGQFAPIPMVPGIDPCPECLQGKCGNCDGTTWDIVADQPAPCPCREPIHSAGHALLGATYPMGEAVLGELPKCNGCGIHGYGEDAHPDFNRDCPIHGEWADQREAPRITDIDTGGLL